MTTPEAEDPQPRDIALEQETPELAVHLEEQSEPEPGESWPRHRVQAPHEP